MKKDKNIPWYYIHIKTSIVNKKWMDKWRGGLCENMSNEYNHRMEEAVRVYAMTIPWKSWFLKENGNFYKINNVPTENNQPCPEFMAEHYKNIFRFNWDDLRCLFFKRNNLERFCETDNL